MRTIRYEWQGKQFETSVPQGWPEDAVAEICAFRAGAAPGPRYAFTGDCGVNILITDE